VKVDGEVRLDRTYAPRGLSRDGNSVAVERLLLVPGRHRIEVAIDDGQEGAAPFQDAREVNIQPGERDVVVFDRNTGFTWDGDESA
jgi:hypothetical protein